jgi:hypothetical protein
MHMSKWLALAIALAAGSACSLILDFDLQVECWCGERWKVQISGASTFSLEGKVQPISAGKTTYETCVTQLEHLALDTADPQDPIYMAIRQSLESGAIAQCEAAGLAFDDLFFSHTDCAMVGISPVTANFVHLGPCWDVESYGEDFEWSELCALDSDSICVDYYDCSSQPVWNENLGDDEAGEDSIAWECDEPPGISALEIRE